MDAVDKVINVLLLNLIQFSRGHKKIVIQNMPGILKNHKNSFKPPVLKSTLIFDSFSLNVTALLSGSNRWFDFYPSFPSSIPQIFLYLWSILSRIIVAVLPWSQTPQKIHGAKES